LWCCRKTAQTRRIWPYGGHADSSNSISSDESSPNRKSNAGVVRRPAVLEELPMRSAPICSFGLLVTAACSSAPAAPAPSFGSPESAAAYLVLRPRERDETRMVILNIPPDVTWRPRRLGPSFVAWLIASWCGAQTACTEPRNAGRVGPRRRVPHPRHASGGPGESRLDGDASAGGTVPWLAVPRDASGARAKRAHGLHSGHGEDV
jgi:hypothetical protein